MQKISKKLSFVLVLTSVWLSFLLVSCTSDFEKGEAFLKEGKYHSSVEMYYSFVREHPKNRMVTQALFKMGDINYQYIGDTQRGLRYFTELVNNYPIDKFTVLAQQRVAEIYKDKLNDCDRAIVEYQKLIDWDPNSESAPYFLYQIGSCYMQLRNYPQALIEFETILKTYPQSEYLGDTIYQIGNINYINSEYEKALKYYSMVISQYQNSKYLPQAKFGLANCYEDLEDFDKALSMYNELLSDYPSKRVVEIRIAGIQERKKKLNR